MATLRELWTELRGSADGGASGYALRLYASGHDIRVYASVEAPDRAAGILIEMPNDLRPRDLKRISTKTFEAVLAEFPGLPAGRCAISLVLRRPEYEDLFEVLGHDIGTAVRDALTREEAARAAVRHIERWRKFVERDRRRLSDEDIRGLIGELAVLARCITKFGEHVSVDAWQKLGGLRDFELPDYSVEAKSTQIGTAPTVRISYPEQLAFTHDRPLYLAVVALAASDLHGMTLSQAVLHVEQMLSPDERALADFRDLLAQRGFIAADAAQYTERFVIGPLRIFAVRPGFPRIPPESVPAGITDVHFSILLAGLGGYEVGAADFVGPPSGLETH